LIPLKILCGKAKLVSGKDIQQRMPVDNLPIEIAGLSHTLNNMLERLQDAFLRLENFSSDIAHELRTPVNNLMMQTQVALSQPRSKDEYLHTLGSNAEEFERLARMISDMLYLAKTENQQIMLCSEDILLEKEIANLLEYYEILAEDRNITLTLAGEAKVQGDKLMLRRAFSNLISNAIKNSFEDGEITINIHTDKQSVLVDVINHGETIPAQILPHLFDRFYRADKARTCCLSEGVGLGLAITQSIAKAHGGKVSVRSKDNLTTFTFAINEDE
ncbi:MAG: heavy metal sensor histidine kinase, partial [Psychromonas sp.]